MATLSELQDRLASHHEQAMNLQNAERDLNEEEQAQLDDHIAQMEGLAPQIERAARIENAARNLPKPAPRVMPAKEPPPPQPDSGFPNTRFPTAKEKSQWNFKNAGEFYNAVKMAKMGGGIDPRLITNTTSTYGSEGVGEDGGFAVPPEWRSAIMDLAFKDSSLYALTDQQTTSSNRIVVPVSDQPQWGSPGGITAYWLDEGGLKVDQKPALKMLDVRANKIAALVFVSDELLDDAPAMGRFIQTKTPMAIDFAVSDAILTGNGVGKPLGIINAPGTITLATRTTTNLVQAADIVGMWGRMPSELRANAYWVMNQSVETSLVLMSQPVKNVAGTENVGGWPLYIPPGGLPNAPAGTLLGRPILTSESCSALGTTGDILLVNFGWYLTLVKSGGIRAETSIHVEFRQDLTAFRFVLRVGGQPWLSAPVAAKNGSNTYSAYVKLPT